MDWLRRVTCGAVHVVSGGVVIMRLLREQVLAELVLLKDSVEVALLSRASDKLRQLGFEVSILFSQLCHCGIDSQELGGVVVVQMDVLLRD